MRWEIAKNVTAVVHNQASIMELSMEILNEQEGWTGFFCTAHCLQLCLKAGFSINAIDRLISYAQKLVAHFHHSVVAIEALKGKQVQMNLAQKKLVKSCATLWNSQLAMLERLLELRLPIAAVLSDEEVTKRSDCHLDLKKEQWTLAEDLVKVLEPFRIATSFLSYEENVFISSVFAVLHGLLDNLSKSHLDNDESTVICQFKDTVSQQIKKRWQLNNLDVSSPLVITSLLDPCFRQFTLTKLEDKQRGPEREGN